MTRFAALLLAIAIGQSRADGLAAFHEVWQTVADTFYDPAFGGLDWAAVRAEFEPQAAAAVSPDDLRRVITAMLARLNQSHFVLLPTSEALDDGPVGPAAPPLDLRVWPEGLIVTRVEPSPDTERAGLLPGSRVLGIDALDTAEWTAEGTDAAARRRALQLWRRARRALHGAPGSQVTLRVKPPGGVETRVHLRREIEAGELMAFGTLPAMRVRTDARELRTPAGRRAGVIRFNYWMTGIDGPVAGAVDRFRDADGLVFDLRGNPGGLAAMMSGIAGHVLADADLLLGRMQTREARLEFRPNPRTVTPDGRRVRPYGGPVAILVDELTGSTSECFAGALQALGRARVFGRLTMGQALPALTRRLPNGDVFMYAIGNFVTASGRALEGAGVMPDTPVTPSAAELAAGRDPILRAALEWLDHRSPLASRPGLLLSSDDLQARSFLPR